MNRTFLLVLLMAALLAGCSASQPDGVVDKTVVQSVDINRYLGTWYEIARFDHSFEKGLTGVTATYSLRKDGKIEVVNAGYKNSLDGTYKKAVGKAYVPDSKEPGKLKVSFFLNFYADYFIMELDTVNYQYALVGSNSDNFIWFLSRTPVMPEETWKLLLESAKRRGYQTDALILVTQKPQ